MINRSLANPVWRAASQRFINSIPPRYRIINAQAIGQSTVPAGKKRTTSKRNGRVMAWVMARKISPWFPEFGCVPADG
jgi:hypothetical protein